MFAKLVFAFTSHLDPDILIVDEVLAVGDIKFQEKYIGEMEEVAGDGRTVLYSYNTPAGASFSFLINNIKFEVVENEELVNIIWTHRGWRHVVLPQLEKI